MKLKRTLDIEIKGAFEDGYTPELAEATLIEVEEVTGLHCVILWDFYDRWGFGGNSELMVRVPTPEAEDDGTADYQMHRAPDGLSEYLNYPDSEMTLDAISDKIGEHVGPFPPNADPADYNVAYKYAPLKELRSH